MFKKNDYIIVTDKDGKHIAVRKKSNSEYIKVAALGIGLSAFGLHMSKKDSKSESIAQELSVTPFALVGTVETVETVEIKEAKEEKKAKVKEKTLDATGLAVLEVVRTKEQKIDAYIKRFYKTAQAEQAKFGIPASITLAQGLLESGQGESSLARKHNNHFGIKCFSKTCKKGHCGNHSDDHHKDFFVKYKTAWESFRAHSKLLQKERYKDLYELDKNDYKGWAKGLKKAGYATDANYAEKLIHYIEFLQLYKYDNE